jgi:hypothetical protein
MGTRQLEGPLPQRGGVGWMTVDGSAGVLSQKRSKGKKQATAIGLAGPSFFG